MSESPDHGKYTRDTSRGINIGMFSVRVPAKVTSEDEVEYVNQQIKQMSALSAYNQTMQRIRGMRWGRPRPDLFGDAWYIHPGFPESIQLLLFKISWSGGLMAVQPWLIFNGRSTQTVGKTN